jgi:hypothetical protein
MEDELTVDDVLTLFESKAQWCREEGEADMRYIVHMAGSIRRDLAAGKSRQEILDVFGV